MKTIPVRRIASAQKEETYAGRFNIRTVEAVLNGRDLVHEHHKHDFNFILALQQGAGVHEIDFSWYEAVNYSIFIVRPGQVHSLALSANSTGFLMEFDPSFYQPKNSISDQRWQKASSKNFCAVAASRFTRLHVILTEVWNEFSLKSEGYIEAIKANLDLFFIELVRQSANPKSISKIESGYMQERFEELLRLLEKNIGSMKNVSQYADLLNLSSFQLNAITKAAVDKTVSDLINEQVILEAKRYLLATPNQIKDIADRLGYEDVSYFIRFFKKHTGQSPEAFRKSFK